jgi:1-acyl-sn-glycerol-3-phosphate acyltransferase
MLRGGRLRRLVRALLYLAFTLPLMPVQGLLVALRSPLARRLPIFYHAACCRYILGFRIKRYGTPSPTRPTLYVANHTSYLDIPLLSAVTEACFIAKAEVATWPLFGWLAKLQRSVFIERRAQRTAEHRDVIRDRLQQGDKLVLFAEGTSHDGMRVLPFKSALFSAADHEVDGAPVTVQPVTVAYLGLDGLPLGRFYRPFLAWYGDMELGAHLWTMLGLGTIDVAVIFHPPVTLAAFGSRKALAEHCHRAVSDGLSAALGGRLPAPSETDRVPMTAPRPALQGEAG